MGADRLAEGTVIGDAYRIVRALSAGGMGEVYVAEQLSTGKLRALKLMHHRLQADPKLRERFVKEARVASSIESAHVVEVIGAGVEQDSGTPWLAMELLDGEDLGEYVRGRGALPATRVLALLEEICHALGEAHDAGIVHRDLKPENIFIAKSKSAGAATTVKILDFGIAKLVAEAQTLGTSAVGSPAWMSPEQAEAGSHITPATDVWAVGLLAFWMLTGSSFWRTAGQQNVSMHAFLKEILFEALPRASKRAEELGAGERLVEGFDEWFERCVHREPRARFRDARELLDAFRALLDGHEDVAPATPGATEGVAPMSTRAFISSGEIGTLPLEQLPTEVAPETAEPDRPESTESDRPEEEEEELAAVQPARGATKPSADDGAGTRAPVVASAVPAVAPTRGGKRGVLVLLGAVVAGLVVYIMTSPGSDGGSDNPADLEPTPATSETIDGESEPSAASAPSETAEPAKPTASTSATSAPTSAKLPVHVKAPAAASSASASGSADANGRPPFNRFINERLVKQRAGLAKTMCASQAGPRVIPATLTFGNDGQIKSLSMPPNVAHTGTGMCVKLHLRHISVPAFSGPEESIDLWVNLD